MYNNQGPGPRSSDRLPDDCDNAKPDRQDYEETDEQQDERNPRGPGSGTPTEPQVRITVILNDQAGGTITITDGTATMGCIVGTCVFFTQNGKTVDLKAIPNADSNFTSWQSINCTSDEDTCSFQVNGVHDVTGVFDKSAPPPPDDGPT